MLADRAFLRPTGLPALQPWMPLRENRSQCGVQHPHGQMAEAVLPLLLGCPPNGRAVLAEDLPRDSEQLIQRGQRLTQDALTWLEGSHRDPGNELDVELPGRITFCTVRLPGSR